MTLLILLVLSLPVALVAPLREVSGYRGDSVTLPSGADPSWTLSSIEWSIFPNNTYIATWRAGKENVGRVERYRGRLSLDAATEDGMEYAVDLSDTEKGYSANKTTVTVRERLQKPTIGSFLSTTERCSWYLDCSSPDAGVDLSWHGVPAGATFANATRPGGGAAMLLAATRPVEITCRSRRNAEEASRVLALSCRGEEPQPTPDLGPREDSWFRERYAIVFLVGIAMGMLLMVFILHVRTHVRRKGIELK
ncbi:hypothetical protein EYF80_053258 [Liparis tanakae]|uniref:Uncharacterized protein n=1 Tax=Liparis tanakae TaxID=230148 RepID=A0A4Z2F712_9TELE|nr:hypothetical protein EYF80_053258 [Liparis tanakae]